MIVNDSDEGSNAAVTDNKLRGSNGSHAIFDTIERVRRRFFGDEKTLDTRNQKEDERDMIGSLINNRAIRVCPNLLYGRIASAIDDRSCLPAGCSDTTKPRGLSSR